jgi:hypothetical protein
VNVRQWREAHHQSALAVVPPSTVANSRVASSGTIKRCLTGGRRVIGALAISHRQGRQPVPTSGDLPGVGSNGTGWEHQGIMAGAVEAKVVSKLPARGGFRAGLCQSRRAGLRRSVSARPAEVYSPGKTGISRGNGGRRRAAPRPPLG